MQDFYVSQVLVKYLDTFLFDAPYITWIYVFQNFS